MRQYGAIRGNVFDSDADWLAEKARAVELRLADKIIEEQMESRLHPAELRLIECDAGGCTLGCCGPDGPIESPDYWDGFLGCRVSGPLTYRIAVPSSR